MNKKIGIIGGGQLGKMLIESTNAWNVQFNILETAPNCPSGRYANEFIQGSIKDAESIKKLAKISDVLTFEIEHIDVDTLLELEASGTEIIPSPKILSIIQDKGLQKNFYRQHGLPTADYTLVGRDDEIIDSAKAIEGNKIVIKTRKEGYDGKGVSIIERSLLSEIQIPESGILLEECLEGAKEISIIVARDQKGNSVLYPACEMEFDPQANLVDVLFAPTTCSEQVLQKAEQVAQKAVEALSGIGLFAVELFVTTDKEVMINEIAPRPHNSGHHTIEACYTSQYEQLARILLDLPLGSTELRSPAAMKNILGTSAFSGGYELDHLDQIFEQEGVYLNWYDKAETKPKRKMGHMTALGNTPSEAMDKLKKINTEILFKPKNND